MLLISFQSPASTSTRSYSPSSGSSLLSSRFSQRMWCLYALVYLLWVDRAPTAAAGVRVVRQAQAQPQPQTTRTLSTDDLSNQVIVGGYREIKNPSSSKGLLLVAYYAVQNLNSSTFDDLSINLSWNNIHINNSSITTSGNVTVSLVIVRGYRQVVAGTNYRFLIMLTTSSSSSSSSPTATNTTTNNSSSTSTSNNNSSSSSSSQGVTTCLGAFAVEVYVSWDDSMDVTRYGKQVECDRAMYLWNHPDAAYGADHADFMANDYNDDSNTTTTSQNLNDEWANHPMTGSSNVKDSSGSAALRNSRASSFLLLLLLLLSGPRFYNCHDLSWSILILASCLMMMRQ